jgi:hypothetical protein
MKRKMRVRGGPHNRYPSHGATIRHERRAWRWRADFREKAGNPRAWQAPHNRYEAHGATYRYARRSPAVDRSASTSHAQRAQCRV